jgi:hypothetical protein
VAFNPLFDSDNARRDTFALSSLVFILLFVRISIDHGGSPFTFDHWHRKKKKKNFFTTTTTLCPANRINLERRQTD